MKTISTRIDDHVWESIESKAAQKGVSCYALVGELLAGVTINNEHVDSEDLKQLEEAIKYMSKVVKMNSYLVQQLIILSSPSDGEKLIEEAVKEAGLE